MNEWPFSGQLRENECNRFMTRPGRKDLYGNLLLIAIAALVAAWLSFAWTALTGFTLATSSHRSRFATEDDRARTRDIVVLTTAIAGPVALWAAMNRRR
jgi:hypothetical protein